MSPQAGERFGYLTVIETLTGSAVGYHDGAWVRVRCVCGRRQLVRARHLRWRVKSGKPISCGCKAPENVRAAVMACAATRGLAR